MTIAEPHLLIFSCCSLCRSSLTSHYGVVFNEMSVKDSTSLLKTSMFPCPRYRSNDILCTFRQCHCSGTSTPITASSIAFATRIIIFVYWGNSIVASACSLRRAEIDHNDAYFTRINRIFGSTPAFYKALLSARIISTSDLNRLPSLRGKRILRPRYSS